MSEKITTRLSICPGGVLNQGGLTNLQAVVVAAEGIRGQEVWLSEDLAPELKVAIFKLLLTASLNKEPRGLWLRAEDKERMTELAKIHDLNPNGQ